MNLENVDDIYTLTPLQAGMLYHTVVAPGSGVYVQQLVMTLRGDVDVIALRSAWNALAQRHAVLRSVFLWDGLDEPVQVVRREVEVPFTTEDWRTSSTAEADARLEQFLHDDRHHGFDLTRAPLFRLKLVERAPGDYWLVWSFHHIILDGWSKEILLRELREMYASHREAREPRLTDHRPFRDYVSHQRETTVLSRSLWTRLLSDIDDPTPLGLDEPVSGEDTPDVLMKETFLSTELTGKISDYARANRVTLNTVVHGAWSILLGMYSGRSTVVFGATLTDRPANLVGVENTVGLFINTLPVRVDLVDSEPLNQWIQSLQELLVEIRSNGSTPLLETKKFSGVPAAQPLFESLLVFENYPMKVETPGPTDLDIADVRYLEQSNYPLVLLLVPGDRMRILAVFDPSRFADETIQQVFADFSYVLDTISSGAAMTVGEVRLLPEDTSRAEGPSCDYLEEFGFPTLVHERILEVVDCFPDRVAVVAGREQLTYRQLERRSREIAGKIVATGLGTGSPVCLLLDRSADMIAAILAVLRAGAAYVPIDTGSPAERVRLIMEDCEARLLLTVSGRANDIDTGDADILLIDTIGEDSKPAPDCHIDPASTAYILYTSGSSGQPKGVEVSHQNLANSTYARFQYYEIRPESFLLLSSYSFDSSVAGIFWTLCSGGKLVVPQKGLEQDVEQLSTLIKRQAVSHTLCLPSLYRLLLEYANPSHLDTLRAVIVAGEACHPDLTSRHFEVLHSTDLFNEYGPTEGTVWTTVEQIEQPLESAVPIGRPIANVSVAILDRQLRTVPRGVPGEIFIGGSGVVKGYVDRAQLTQDAFVEGVDGFENLVLYRTGDLGRMRTDGRIEFLGRLDSQVKIRGHRIEPAEIEHVISGHNRVREVVVVPVPARDAGAGKGSYPALPADRLRAFVTLTELASLDQVRDDIRTFVGSRLPDYMVPASFVVVDEMPRTSTGKIDRKKLAQRPAHAEHRSAAPSEPVSEEEAILLDVWKQVLRTHEIGLDDNFFEIGGDSILSIEMSSQARRRRIKIGPDTLIAAPTIRELARMVGATPQEKSFEFLRTIRDGSGLAPIVFVHGEGGEIIYYRDLALALEPDRPCYGFQARGLDGSQPHTSIEEMAGAYVEELEQLSLREPYYLVAVCGGSHVAFEMGRRLIQRGATHVTVFLVDPGWLRPTAEESKRLREMARDSATPNLLHHRIRQHLGKLISRAKAARRTRQVLRGMKPEHRAVVKAFRQAKTSFEARPFDGRVVVILSEQWQRRPEIDEETERWKSLVSSPIDIHYVPGEHTDVLRDLSLPEIIKTYLERHTDRDIPMRKPPTAGVAP